MRFAALVLTALLTIPALTHADPLPKGFRYGIDLGGIGLFGDLNSQGTRVGAGLLLAYQFNDRHSLDVNYVGASFEDVDHRTIDIGGSIYDPESENRNHLSAGVSFVHNDFKLLSRSGDAAGVYVGGGMNWDLTTKLSWGYDVRYHKMFRAKATVAGREVTTVDDSYTLMLSLAYAPDLTD